jgi:hypothetical protein
MMRRGLWCLMAVGLAVPQAAWAGASKAGTASGLVRQYDDDCGPGGYSTGNDSPYPAYEHCDDSNHFEDGSCCYEG